MRRAEEYIDDLCYPRGVVFDDDYPVKSLDAIEAVKRARKDIVDECSKWFYHAPDCCGSLSRDDPARYCSCGLEEFRLKWAKQEPTNG